MTLTTPQLQGDICVGCDCPFARRNWTPVLCRTCWQGYNSTPAGKDEIEEADLVLAIELLENEPREMG